MNSKELKSKKKVKKSKLNLQNGGQQVFVLPPNLLQKLGINLGNMETTPKSQGMECRMSTFIPNDEYGHSSSNKEHELNSNTINNETSIIKTANLMKESVFLSPTFNTVNLSNSTSSHIEECVETSNAEPNYTPEKRQKLFDKKLSSSNVTSEHDLTNSKQKQSYNDSECDVGLPIQNNILHINGSTTSEKSVSQNETKKVISIISEETVSVAKLNELKILQMPATNTMIPASLKTIIGKKATKKSTQSESIPSFAKVITDNIDMQLNESKDKLISSEIEMSETENIVNLDDKTHCNTKNACNSNAIFETNKQVSQNNEAETVLNRSIHINDSEIILKESIDCKTQNFCNSNNSLETNKEVSQSNKEEKILNRSFDSNNSAIMLKKSIDCKTENFYTSNNILETNEQVSENDEDETILNRSLDSNNSEIMLEKSIDCDTENFCTSINILETNKQVSQNNEVETILNGCIDSKNSGKMFKKSLDHPIVESNLDFRPSKNKFGVTDELVSKESMLTDNDNTANLKSPISNDYNKEQPTNVDCPILIYHSYAVEPVDSSKLDSIKINDIKQNAENCLSEIINSNNNIWNHNKSDVRQNNVVILEDSRVDDEYQKNIEANSSISDKDISTHIDVCEPGFIAIQKDQNNIEHSQTKYNPITLQKNEEPSGKQELLLDINDDNTTSLPEDLETAKKPAFYNSIDDEGINKLSLPLNPKRNNLISKLCIQGVEKPGGFKIDIQKNVSLKTYSNNNKHKLHGKRLSPEDLNFIVKFDNDFNIDLNERTIDLLDCQQFCKCCDYGILDYNQLGKSYEHIHYTRKIPLDCSPNIIFGIYDNEMKNIAENIENLDHIEDVTDQSDTDNSRHYICWSNAENELEKSHYSHIYPQDSELIQNYSIDQTHASALIHDLVHHADVTSHLNSLPNINMKAEIRAEEKCYSKSDSNNSNKLECPNRSRNISNKMDLQNQSRKRKTSDNCAEVCGNKRVKNHKISTENPTDIQQDKNLEHGFKGWDGSNEIEHQDGANDQKYDKCAVCGMDLLKAEWSTHIATKHLYLAWKEGEPPVDLEDKDEIKQHLNNIIQELGQLQCSKCGLIRKYAKSFLQHIKSCYKSSDMNDCAHVPCLSNINEAETSRKCETCGHHCKNDSEYKAHRQKCASIPGLRTRKPTNEISTTVTCGVCKQGLKSSQWINHIQKKHSYRAWREGEPPLNFQDQATLCRHLYIIMQKHGPLVCSKCFKSYKYVKLFLQHIESCTGPTEADDPLSISCAEWESILDTSLIVSGPQSTKLVKCGQCQQEMESRHWLSHIKEMHRYVSWQEGTSPIDTSDNEAVRRYLAIVVRKLGALACPKCGVSRKYAKLFLSHVDKCKGSLVSDTSNIDTTLELDNTVDDSSQHVNTTLEMSATDSQEEPVPTVKCGVCQKEMKDTNWISHISMNHEYLAWKETDTPIDINNYDVISQHLTNVIKDIGTLKCAECGRRIKYAMAFLVHIKICYGKTYVAIDVDSNSSDSDTDASDTDIETSAVSEDEDTRIVKCGVCSQEVEARLWNNHRYKQHNYLAWRDGDTALDLEDDESVGSHLKSILRATGHLTCSKCGYRRRQSMPFYAHIKTCEGPTESSRNLNFVTEESEGNVKCAVCLTEVANTSWIDHIAKEHDYMAWRDGDYPLNKDDETSIKEHLHQIAHIAGELICNKCGMSRKYVKSYLQHIRGCTSSEGSIDGISNAPELKNDETIIVTCALCKSEMDDSLWMDHIAKEHNYVSWKTNNPPLVLKDEKALRDHLYNIVQSIGSLTCQKCGLVRKYAKTYLQHIESCQKVTWTSINKILMKTKERGDTVRCAVCGAELDDTEWLQHIASEHNYLAWRDRDPALNIEDEDDVRRHLKNIIREEGYLRCPKCKVRRKYAKLYLQHVNNCKGIEEDDDETEQQAVGEVDPDESVIVKCGVCAEEVAKSHWIFHIQKKHNYLAWEEGKEPVDVNSKESLYSHLSAINALCKGLSCNSCGLVCKFVKGYLHHVQNCSERDYVNSNEIVECGVCREKVQGQMWRDHAMQTHYNIAWIEGDTPIDLRNFFNVDKYLKEYQQQYHKLVCNICGLSRSSLAGFYAHILICGKTDEEIEKLKDVCEKCNQKFLCIYKTQHYWTHRVQEMAKERKMQETLKREQEMLKDDQSPGRRKAAEKARNVIGVYVAKLAGLKCKSCTFETDSKEDLAKHTCFKRSMNSNEESDDSLSIKLEDFSEEESEDTSVDSELSNEEDQEDIVVKRSRKRVRNGGKQMTKSSKFPFEVTDTKSYLQECKTDHFELFYMRDTLFPNWRESTYEIVPDELMSQYMPQLTESCKVSISNGSWKTYERFESRKEKGCRVLFTGGSIQCMSWAPEHPAAPPDAPSLLAVGTHRGADGPRLRATETPSHPALVQIWNFYTFNTLPKLAFGLALDYGTVWAMDWCPSGSRDLPDSVGSDDIRPRLGLLAVACSNGSAYVLSVPYPDETRSSELTFYKIKPCVELRLTRGSNKYQATTVNWPLFKGYTTVSVGYGDGTVALYDLATESPLLTAKVDDLNILYPFQDERIHNSSVTGLTSSVLGAWCSSSATGSTAGVAAAGAVARGGPGARPVRAHAALAAAAPTFMPHWPNIMLAGDDTIVGLSPSELEWGYVGRRVGSVRALATCARRTRIAALVPPLLQAMRPHPAAFKSHKTIYKKNVAMLDMVPLAKKRSKHSNDKLSMKVEPITYESAIASYGIQFKFERDFDKSFSRRVQKHRVPFPERFPLADVPALAYCPAAANYTKLALATHAGLLLLFEA